MINGIGLLPYSERLEILGLTTLAERRARGDLIEVYKAKHDFSLTNNVFKFGRSGLNLLSKFCPSSNAKCNTIKRNFLKERVREYWNKLPNDIKMAPNINSFKNRLESYKLDCISSANECPGNFWESSDAVLNHIGGANYGDNKSSHNEFLKKKSFCGKKKIYQHALSAFILILCILFFFIGACWNVSVE